MIKYLSNYTLFFFQQERVQSGCKFNDITLRMDVNFKVNEKVTF